MGFLQRVAGPSLRDGSTSSAIRRELGVEPLLLPIERSRLRGFSWLGWLLVASLCSFSGHIRLGGGPGADPKTLWRDYIYPLWPGNTLGISQEELERGMSGFPSWTCCVHNPTSDKRGHLVLISHFISSSQLMQVNIKPSPDSRQHWSDHPHL